MPRVRKSTNSSGSKLPQPRVTKHNLGYYCINLPRYQSDTELDFDVLFTLKDYDEHAAYNDGYGICVPIGLGDSKWEVKVMATH